jgi:hypothetical protein
MVEVNREGGKEHKGREQAPMSYRLLVQAPPTFCTSIQF